MKNSHRRLLLVLLIAAALLATNATASSSSAQQLVDEIARVQSELDRKQNEVALLAARLKELQRRLGEFHKRDPKVQAAIIQFERQCAQITFDKKRPPRQSIVAVSFFESGGISFTDDDVSLLPTLTDLTFVEFSANGITDVTIQRIAGLPKLRSLIINGEKGITDAALSHIGKIASLTMLSLDYNRLSDRGIRDLAGMKNLEDLSLNDTDITDSAVPHLSKLKKLEKLSFRRTKITAKGLAALQRNLPKCKITWRPRAAGDGKK